MYRLALPLLSPETLSLSSKSRIFLYNAHLALYLSGWTTQLPAQMNWKVLSFSKLELALEVLEHYRRIAVADQTTSRIIANWERM